MYLMNRPRSIGIRKSIPFNFSLEYWRWLHLRSVPCSQQSSLSCFHFFDSEPRRRRGDAAVPSKDRRAKAPERGDSKEEGDAETDAGWRQKEGAAGQAEFPNPRQEPCSIPGHATTCTPSGTTASAAAGPATTTPTTKAVYSESAAALKSTINGSKPKRPHS